MVTSKEIDPNTVQDDAQTQTSHSQIKQVIGVISAKGGVGKSFITSLLACELTRGNKQVGILDADFFGSSIHKIFGVHGPAKVGQYSFLPLQSQAGVKIISPSCLMEDEEKIIFWKESLAGKVVEELWKEVEWGSLDYLLVDLPPATSELAVSAMKSLPFTGLIIVTTPSGLSNALNTKTVTASQTLGVPVLGIVENMAFYLDSDNGNKEYFFGQNHTEELSKKAEAVTLAHIPFDPEVGELCDAGKIEEVFFDESAALIQSLLQSLASLAEKKASAPKPTNQPQNETSSSPSHPPRQGFSEKVIQLIRSKENVGVLEQPDGQGYYLGSCGDRMQIDLGIVAGRIKKARFLADGCGATFACGTMITKMACSKTLTEAQKLTSEELLIALDGLPDDHLHCAELAVMTLKEAIIDAVEGHGKLKNK